MSLLPIPITGLASPSLAGVRSKIAQRRNRLYVKSEKLWALLFSRDAKKILFAGYPDWTEAINGGFRRSRHHIEFGSITEDSFQRYDVIVPLSLPALKEARRSAPHKSAIPLPTAESVNLCEEKYEFNQALIKAGFGQFIPKVTQGLGLEPPYILKKCVGSWGIGCYVIRNRDDEQAQFHRIIDRDYFCQELIPGPTEFATHILFVDGRIVKALNIKYEFAGDMPIKGQDGALLQVVHRCPYLDLFARILRTIHFEGLCCVNYKVAKGRPFLLEINPRFGGSLGPYFFSFIRHLR